MVQTYYPVEFSVLADDISRWPFVLYPIFQYLAIFFIFILCIPDCYGDSNIATSLCTPGMTSGWLHHLIVHSDLLHKVVENLSGLLLKSDGRQYVETNFGLKKLFYVSKEMIYILPVLRCHVWSFLDIIYTFLVSVFQPCCFPNCVIINSVL